MARHGKSQRSRLLRLTLLGLCMGQSQTQSSKKATQRRTCKRIDARKLAGKSRINVSKPTIITHMLDELSPDVFSAWTEAALIKKFANETLTAKHLGGIAIWDHEGNQAIDDKKPSDFVGILKRMGLEGDLHGTLFILSQHRITKVMTATIVDPGSASPAFAKAVELVRPPHEHYLSIGRESQWNYVHRHASNLFVQVLGRKGWVMFPSPNLPEEWIDDQNSRQLNGDLIEGVLDQLSLCSYVMSCKRWADLSGLSSAECEGKSNDAVSRYKGLACEVKQGEAIFVPKDWWHGTCNLDTWNAGFSFIGNEWVRADSSWSNEKLAAARNEHAQMSDEL